MNLQNQVDYLQTTEQSDIFDGLSVPDPLNAETAKSAIMIRCGLLTPVYSEPEVMRAAIAQWSVRMQWTFQHLINIIQAEYSPIENTDKYAEHTTSNEGGTTRTHSGTDSRSETHGGTDTRTEGGTTGTTHGGSDNVENTVSAYNANTYQPDRKEQTNYGETETVTHGKTDALQHGETVSETQTHGLQIADTSEGTETYTEHTHGNIGVTTNQQMIEQELELLRHFDIYGFIAEKFESELCLMIY